MCFVNAWCNFVTDSCHQIGIHVVAGMTPKTNEMYYNIGDESFMLEIIAVRSNDDL